MTRSRMVKPKIAIGTFPPAIKPRNMTVEACWLAVEQAGDLSNIPSRQAHAMSSYAPIQGRDLKDIAIY